MGWGGRGKKGQTWAEGKEYIATHASTYQLISSKFLSSLKHSPKVDCGREKTNKTVKISGKGPELKHVMSYVDITSHYNREGEINTVLEEDSVVK